MKTMKEYNDKDHYKIAKGDINAMFGLIAEADTENKHYQSRESCIPGWCTAANLERYKEK